MIRSNLFTPCDLLLIFILSTTNQDFPTSASSNDISCILMLCASKAVLNNLQSSRNTSLQPLLLLLLLLSFVLNHCVKNMPKATFVEFDGGIVNQTWMFLCLPP